MARFGGALLAVAIVATMSTSARAQACDPAATRGAPGACGIGYACVDGGCAPVCTPPCPSDQICSAPAVCSPNPAAVPPPAPAPASEDTPEACSNGRDDDSDDLVDCAEPSCRVLPFCSSTAAPAAPAPAPTTPPAYSLGDYAPRQPTHLASSPRWGLVFGGLGMFLAIYAASASVTATVDEDGDDFWMYVPLAGPWLELAIEDVGGYTALVVPSGILQLVGLTLMVIGVAAKRQRPVYADRALDFDVADGWSFRPTANVGTNGETSIGGVLVGAL